MPQLPIEQASFQPDDALREETINSVLRCVKCPILLVFAPESGVPLAAKPLNQCVEFLRRTFAR